MDHNLIKKHLTMSDLIEARNRYQRMLNALGYTSRIDHDLRCELMEAIEIYDEKIGRLSAANCTIPPGTLSFGNRAQKSG